jgi:hypothetical protein
MDASLRAAERVASNLMKDEQIFSLETELSSAVQDAAVC